MSSGVKVADEVKISHDRIKMKKDIKYVTYKIENKKLIVVDKIGEPGEDGKLPDMDAFRETLPAKEPRYALVDIAYETDDGRPQTKLTFVVWNPDEGSVKEKMLYSSSKDAIKKKFEGIMKEIQANEAGDLTDDEISAKMKRV